jgi:hypothetical protein
MRRARRITGAPIVLADNRRQVGNIAERGAGSAALHRQLPWPGQFMDADGAGYS